MMNVATAFFKSATPRRSGQALAMISHILTDLTANIAIYGYPSFSLKDVPVLYSRTLKFVPSIATIRSSLPVCSFFVLKAE
jgi:hypothetical protein